MTPCSAPPGRRSLRVGGICLGWLLLGCSERARPVADLGGVPGESSTASGGASAGPEASGGNLASGGTNPSGQGGSTRGGAPTYLKASNTDAGDLFGVSVAFSADGNTLVVGANREGGAATGVDGDALDDSLADSGAVYHFSRSGTAWHPGAYLKASNSGTGDAFGSALALSADGTTLAVGAPFEASATSGIDGDQSDDSAPDAGAVYVFVRSQAGWTQQAYVKASNPDENDVFGFAVALSSDGNTLAVGADGEDGSATGVDGDQTDKSLYEAGAVYVFVRSGTVWRQSAFIKASNTARGDHFGGSVALSADGATLAVGAAYEDSAGAGVDADPGDDSAQSAGAAYLFLRDGAGWRQQAYLKPAQNDGRGHDNFGSSVSLSADGNTLAVGAAGDDSPATGIDGNPNDTSMPFAGAAYLFARDGEVIRQLAYVKASNTGAGDEFGHHLSLSADGGTLVVGAALEAGSASGIDGDPNDDASPGSGAVYVFGVEGSAWRQRAYMKAHNVGGGDRFGWSVALTGDGDALAVGASREASIATGIDGDPSDDAAPQAGAVYVYLGLSAIAP